MSGGTLSRGISQAKVAQAFFTPTATLPARFRFPKGATYLGIKDTPMPPALPRLASGAAFESMIPPGALDPPLESVEELALEDGPGASPEGAISLNPQQTNKHRKQ